MNWRHGVLCFSFARFRNCNCDRLGQRTHACGEAAVVKNEVVHVTGSGSSRISVGDAVLRDEIVRTGPDSAARLVMADSTNLSLGANATMKLDRTVFNDENTYRDIAIRLTTGAFRFVTGHSEKTAYKITTSVATIGVRGTVLDILAQRGATTVVLQEGASSVCTLCFNVQLTQPGDTAVITSTGGRSTIKKSNNPPWTFAAAARRHPGSATSRILRTRPRRERRRWRRPDRHVVRTLTHDKIRRKPDRVRRARCCCFAADDRGPGRCGVRAK